MDNPFFERPILNSPYQYPSRHWELDESGQPTQRILETRRKAEFVTPIPKPKRRSAGQKSLGLDEGKGLSTDDQQYVTTSIINDIRYHVDQWRKLSNPGDWNVTPETARLLQHWRHFKFSSVRPFFCQLEAVETAIWMTEVAPRGTKAMRAGRTYRTGQPQCQSGAFAHCSEACYRSRQNDGDGYADRLANHQ